MNFDEYITRDPRVCGGEPVIRGTRIPMRTILASLPEGDSVDQVVASFPALSERAVRAVIAFAAASAEAALPRLRRRYTLTGLLGMGKGPSPHRKLARGRAAGREML